MEEQLILEEAGRELSACVRYLAEKAGLEPGAVVVLGCSTSEVTGGHIGKNSVPELGQTLAQAMISTCRELSLHAVFQCCEHLNRALIMEKSTLKALGLLRVNVRPVPKAGGSTAAAAFDLLEAPAAAAAIQADAAIDVGDTLVGMHIRPVAVPLRMNGAKVGQAHVTMAFSRLPYIGGARAQYPEG